MIQIRPFHRIPTYSKHLTNVTDIINSNRNTLVLLPASVSREGVAMAQGQLPQRPERDRNRVEITLLRPKSQQKS